ncbi:MAG: hypothetical protein IAF38_02690, partial [Bacteroidia bacterium]|nr:hypothetical protein [Bacteroidia bacterium]
MKLKNVILLFFFSASLITFSQSAKEQKLLDKLCKEACDAIEATDISANDKQEDLQMKLGLALLPALTENSKEIKSVWGLDITNPDDARQMGEKLGTNLVYKCEKFKKLALQLAAQKTGEENGGTEKTATVTTSSTRGSIDKIDCTELCVVYFKTQSDETIRLYWMEKFNGSEI